MSSIPASHIVNVRPRVITGGSDDLEMNGLLLSVNSSVPTGSMVLEFGSIDSVGAYFGLLSDEYAASVTYFAGNDGKTSAPRSFYIARRIAEDVAGWLRSAQYIGTVAGLAAVTDGALVIEIDNVSHSFGGIDFSGATSLSAVAAIMQTVIDTGTPGVTVTYNNIFRSFVITSSTTGENSMVGYGEAPASGTDLAALLGLTQAAGAVTSAGMAALSVDQQMAAIRRNTENWVTFTTAWEAETEEMLLWAKWATENYGWLYIPHTTDPNTVLATSEVDPASVLMASGYEYYAIIYGDIHRALMMMGTIASISWQQSNGTITLAFKSQSGLAPDVVDKDVAEVLESKNCNYYGNFATRNAQFAFLYPGVLGNGDYRFIDPYINSVWLNNRLQVAIMDGLKASRRVPYNESGYAMIRGWMQGPINDALNNGAVEVGIELSEGQKTQVMNEAGQDITPDLAIVGYFIQILDPGSQIRAQRESPVINFYYTYGGSVHKIDVASTAIL